MDSPLSRLAEQGGVGSSWQPNAATPQNGKTKKFSNSLYDPSRIVTQQGTKIIVEANVGRIIGTTQSGATTTWIRMSIFTSNETVITSYPVPNPTTLIIR